MLSLRIPQRAYGASHLILVPLLVIKDYRPLGVEILPHGGTCVPLKKGQVVHGYLDKNEKPKKTKFEGKTFWLGALEKGTVSWDTALYLPNECIEPLALYKPNWQRMEVNDGRSALHAAAFEGHALICDILIKHGWSCWTKTEWTLLRHRLNAHELEGT